MEEEVKVEMEEVMVVEEEEEEEEEEETKKEEQLGLWLASGSELATDLFPKSKKRRRCRLE